MGANRDFNSSGSRKMRTRSYAQLVRSDFQSLTLSVVFLSVLSLGRLAFCGPIHDAVKKGDLAKVEELLKSDPSLVSEPGPGGETPLHLAAGLGRLDIAEYLISQKADVNSYGKDKFRSTPLSLAVHYGQLDMVAMLLAHNADVDEADSMGQTPLRGVISDSTRQNVNAVKIAELLFQHGANLNPRDEAGNTPLHYAAYYADVPMIEFLIGHGARTDVTDDYGKTPAQMARIKKIRDIISTSSGPTATNTNTALTANQSGSGKSAHMTYSLDFVKSDLQFEAVRSKVPFDQISSQIDGFIAGQLAPEGFEVQTSAKDGAPRVLLSLETAEVVQYMDPVLVLTVRLKVSGSNMQPVFSKEYVGAAMPNVFAKVDTLLKGAEYHIAETVASDPSFSKALISAVPQTPAQ
jgi:ankyrin repeat protein